MKKITSIILFIILILAVLADLIIPIIIGNQYPGYDHLVNTISSLGAAGSPVQIYQCINLIILGILIIIFAIGEYILKENKSWPSVLCLISIFIYAIGCILAGIFPEDQAGVKETLSGKIHGIASFIGFIFLFLYPLWSVWKKDLKELVVRNISFFVLAIITYLIFLLSFNSSSGILKYTGMFQRLNMIIIYGAVIFNYSHYLKKYIFYKKN